MKLTVARAWLTPQSTCGRLEIDGIFFCYTLEPRMSQSNGKPYAIPAGTYAVQIGFSPKRGYDVPHLLDVPGFDEIEIHVGNKPADTEGCTLVGETHSPDWVGGSDLAFLSLMKRLSAERTGLTVTYENSDA